MTNPEIAERAEQLTRRRARMMPFLAMIFLIQQISYFSGTQGERAVDHVKIGAWLVLTVVLLIGLGTGGAWLQPKAVRDLSNVETTRQHRSRAIEMCFWTMAVDMTFSVTSEKETIASARGTERGNARGNAR